jgi:hypothetical protein
MILKLFTAKPTFIIHTTYLILKLWVFHIKYSRSEKPTKRDLAIGVDASGFEPELDNLELSVLDRARRSVRDFKYQKQASALDASNHSLEAVWVPGVFPPVFYLAYLIFKYRLSV